MTKINVDLIYPVGSIYMSVNSTNPSTLFGGTWEKIKGRFLFGECGQEGMDANTSTSFGTITKGSYAGWFPAGEIGGEVYHTLTINEMPTHSHQTSILNPNGGNGSWVIQYNTNGGENITTSNNGGNQPHGNMPPYLSVYMWKRTA